MTDVLAPGTFLTPLVLRHVGGRRYRVEQDFTYITRAGRRLDVPAGFVTDGGSVPRLLWPLYPPFGSDCDEAYVLHDYGYANAELLKMTRGEADALMREVMDVKGFRASGRGAVLAGVRLGGWLSWRKHRRAARKEKP